MGNFPLLYDDFRLFFRDLSSPLNVPGILVWLSRLFLSLAKEIMLYIRVEFIAIMQTRIFGQTSIPHIKAFKVVQGKNHHVLTIKFVT